MQAPRMDWMVRERYISKHIGDNNAELLRQAQRQATSDDVEIPDKIRIYGEHRGLEDKIVAAADFNRCVADRLRQRRQKLMDKERQFMEDMVRMEESMDNKAGQALEGAGRAMADRRTYVTLIERHKNLDRLLAASKTYIKTLKEYIKELEPCKEFLVKCAEADMCYEGPMDIVNRYHTLTIVKKENMELFNSGFYQNKAMKKELMEMQAAVEAQNVDCGEEIGLLTHRLSKIEKSNEQHRDDMEEKMREASSDHLMIFQREMAIRRIYYLLKQHLPMIFHETEETDDVIEQLDMIQVGFHLITDAVAKVTAFTGDTLNKKVSAMRRYSSASTLMPKFYSQQNESVDQSVVKKLPKWQREEDSQKHPPAPPASNASAQSGDREPATPCPSADTLIVDSKYNQTYVKGRVFQKWRQTIKMVSELVKVSKSFKSSSKTNLTVDQRTSTSKTARGKVKLQSPSDDKSGRYGSRNSSLTVGPRTSVAGKGSHVNWGAGPSRVLDTIQSRESLDVLQDLRSTKRSSPEISKRIDGSSPNSPAHSRRVSMENTTHCSLRNPDGGKTEKKESLSFVFLRKNSTYEVPKSLSRRGSVDDSGGSAMALLKMPTKDTSEILRSFEELNQFRVAKAPSSADVAHMRRSISAIQASGTKRDSIATIHRDTSSARRVSKTTASKADLNRMKSITSVTKRKGSLMSTSENKHGLADLGRKSSSTTANSSNNNTASSSSSKVGHNGTFPECLSGDDASEDNLPHISTEEKSALKLPKMPPMNKNMNKEAVREYSGKYARTRSNSLDGSVTNTHWPSLKPSSNSPAKSVKTQKYSGGNNRSHVDFGCRKTVSNRNNSSKSLHRGNVKRGVISGQNKKGCVKSSSHTTGMQKAKSNFSCSCKSRAEHADHLLRQIAIDYGPETKQLEELLPNLGSSACSSQRPELLSNSLDYINASSGTRSKAVGNPSTKISRMPRI